MRRGIVLAEALVSIAILLVATTIVSSIISDGLKANAVARDYLVAQNLATEAVEVVKSVKQTNILNHPLEPECWNGSCDDVAFVADTSFVALRDDSGHWVLEEVGGNLDLSQSINDQVKTNFGMHFHDGQYLHSANWRNWGGEPQFYREVRFTEVDDDSATFEVKVQWFEGSELRTITRSNTILKI